MQDTGSEFLVLQLSHQSKNNSPKRQKSLLKTVKISFVMQKQHKLTCKRHISKRPASHFIQSQRSLTVLRNNNTHIWQHQPPSPFSLERRKCFFDSVDSFILALSAVLFLPCGLLSALFLTFRSSPSIFYHISGTVENVDLFLLSYFKKILFIKLSCVNFIYMRGD